MEWMRGLRLMLAVAVVVVLGGCTQNHAAADQEVMNSDCYACHKADYDGTTMPVHPGSKPTDCKQCHSTTSWVPALEGSHPEDKFVISKGPHSRYMCLDCHRPDLFPAPVPAADNVSCIDCHTGEHSMNRMVNAHTDVNAFAWTPSRPTFCRDCHPLGRK
jgi:hypothetical protein